MYNYAKNLTTVGFVSVTDRTLLAVTKMPDTQPDAPQYLVDLAVQIASKSPEVIAALGYAPDSDDARMENTKTALNLTRCQRSRHLCLAPTFVEGDRALWAIVDLTDGVLVGVRWTEVGEYGPAITQRSLQDDIVTQLYCNKNTALDRGDWRMDFILTSSDGLRISDVQYKGRAILESAKLVDWHVSYSTTEAFGYSDAIGCPIFSQAAVVAFQGPTVEEITENGEVVGFRLQQEFWVSSGPCRAVIFTCNASISTTTGDSAWRLETSDADAGRTAPPPTALPALAADNSFATWANSAWETWSTEGWQAQSDSEPTAKGYQYRFTDSSGAGFYIEPGRGQFEGERGDNAFIFVTLDHPDRDEGDSDMITIGPCCNVNYEQGPERFIDGESIENAQLILWYVPQVENDGAPANNIAGQNRS